MYSLAVHLLRDILVASSFLVIMNEAVNKAYRFLCGWNYSTHLDKYLGTQLLDLMLKLCLAL